MVLPDSVEPIGAQSYSQSGRKDRFARVLAKAPLLSRHTNGGLEGLNQVFIPKVCFPLQMTPFILVGDSMASSELVLVPERATENPFGRGQ